MMGVLSPHETRGGDLIVIPRTGDPYVAREDEDSGMFKPIGIIGTEPGEFIKRLTRTTSMGVQKVLALPKEIRNTAGTVFQIFNC